MYIYEACAFQAYMLNLSFISKRFARPFKEFFQTIPGMKQSTTIPKKVA